MQKEHEEIKHNISDMTHNVRFLVVGGGIAGVTCAETLASYCPDESILLLTESNLIKTIANLQPVARYLYKFDVQEHTLGERKDNILAPTIHTFIDKLTHINGTERYVLTNSGCKIQYNYLCLCTGGRPSLISENNSLVLGIRDTDSVVKFQEYLRNATRIVLVGNGGIASELAYELKGIEIHWVIKDDHIAAKFMDAGASHFFQQHLESKQLIQGKASESIEQNEPKSAIKRWRYDEMIVNYSNHTNSKSGAALGPDWHRHFELKGAVNAFKDPSSKRIIHYNAEVLEMENIESGMLVTLSTGEKIECNFLISATGVYPQLNFTCEPCLNIANDGGIKVDEMMRTSVPYVYSAGDVCTAAWQPSEHWFQMRLWTQARQMGLWAGRSMSANFQGECVYQDFCFELFGHVTELFGFPVILLGLYNGQGLGTDYELLLRTTPSNEYIKFVLKNGRLRGALLIGNSDIAETCENLILNCIDLTPYGDAILDPDIDIEDYFD